MAQLGPDPECSRWRGCWPDDLAGPMTLLACLCAGVAAWLVWSPPRWTAQRLTARPGTVRTPFLRTALGAVAAVVVGACACLLAVTGAAGAVAGVVLGAGFIVAAVLMRMLVLRASDRRMLMARSDVAHACTVLAAQVRVGRIPSEALHIAAEDCPVLAESDRVDRLGGDVTLTWRTASRRPGHQGLMDLARAWQLSTQSGAPLAGALEQVAVTLTADEEVRAVVAGELAAPRATGKIMAVLPFCGLGLGFLIGGDPVNFLLAGPYGWACLLAGVTLAGAGVLWIDRLARAAGHGA